MTTTRSTSRSRIVLVQRSMLLLTIVCLTLTAASVSVARAQLKSPEHQADYIIIAPPDFVPALAPFVQWRSAHGMHVLVADTKQIYSEFTDSLGASGAIRAFVSCALHTWKAPKPKYVLLAGDAEFIPSCRVRSIFAEYPEYKEDSVSVDEWYAVNLYDADVKPDIAIGRFPVKTAAELGTIAAKTMLFEDSLTRKSYANDFLLIADSVDAVYFEEAADLFCASIIPSFYKKTVVRFADTTVRGEPRRTMLAAMNASTLFVTNFIHGNPKQWSRHNYFNEADVASLARNRRPFILTSVACSQSFDTGNDSVIVEKLLLLPDGGAVATFTATGLAYMSEEVELLKAFYTGTFAARGGRIGDLILAAKRNSPSYEQTPAVFDNNIRLYTLLGDPALRLPADLVTGVAPQTAAIPAAFSLGQNYPNPFNPSTTISYELPAAAHVTLTVYDVLGCIVSVLVDDMKPRGVHTVSFDARGLASGVYFYRFQGGGRSEMKKMTLMK